MARRVVVTGIGAVSPLGLTMKDSWKALLDHQCGVTTLSEALEWQGLSMESLQHELELSKDLPCQVAAPVRWEQKDNRTSRNVQFALSAGQQALEASNLLDWVAHTTPENPNVAYRMGVSMGCGMSSTRDICQAFHTLNQPSGYRKISPHFVPKSLTNSAAGRLSIAHGLLGPNCTTSTACAAASHAIGDAYRLIQLGHADVMLAGGSEAGIEPVALAGFCRLRALSTGFDDPTRSSRPFDAQRDGFVMGEGAAVLVLEALEHAQARSAPVLAEVVGYGLAGDGHHITAPDPDGRGAQHAMQMALGASSSLPKPQVDYVNAHATSTPVGDDIEARVIERVLTDPQQQQQRTQRPLWVSSTKGATGHLLGAAGAIEAAFTVQTLVDQTLPPTLNLENPSVDKDNEPVRFEHVTSTREGERIDVAICNSFGFGGTNASLMFARVVDETAAG